MNVCRQELPELSAAAAGVDHRFRCHLDDQTRAQVWERKRAAIVSEDAA
jgi:hypothetical protein